MADKELTSNEISSKLNINQKNLYPKLSRLKRENRIMVINDKKPYLYRTCTPKVLLKQLYNIMGDLMEPKNNRIDEFLNKKPIIKKIKEIIGK